MTIGHESQTTNRKIRVHNVVCGGSFTQPRCVPRNECKINYPLNRAGDRVREIQGPVNLNARRKWRGAVWSDDAYVNAHVHSRNSE